MSLWAHAPGVHGLTECTTCLLHRPSQRLRGSFWCQVASVFPPPSVFSTVFYIIAGVLPYLIPTSVIMVHFSTFARPCVHKMTGANQTKSGFRRLVFTKFPQKWTKIVKNYPTFLLESNLLQLYRTQRNRHDESKP